MMQLIVIDIGNVERRVQIKLAQILLIINKQAAAMKVTRLII
jgi:hypothetical protein